MLPSEEYLKDVSSNLLKYRDEGFLCDSVIVTGESGFWAHSVIVSAACPALKAAFSAEPERTGTGLYYVYLHEYDLFTVEVAVHFMYTGILLLPVEYKKDLALGTTKDNRLFSLVKSLEKIGISKERINKCEVKFIRLLCFLKKLLSGF